MDRNRYEYSEIKNVTDRTSEFNTFLRYFRFYVVIDHAKKKE